VYVQDLLVQPHVHCTVTFRTELLTDCDVDTLRDFVILLLLAIVYGLKSLVSLDDISMR
jgi:hypothetical protein